MPTKKGSITKEHQLSVLTFNFAGIPIFSKQYHNRLQKLIKELIRVTPDVICLQEIWLPRTKIKIISALAKYGYGWSYHAKPRLRFNGLLICSKKKILHGESISLKKFFNGFNRSIVEMLGDKGLLLVRLQLNQKNSLYIFNVHLNVDWTHQEKKGCKYTKIQSEALQKIASRINSLGNNKILICGDFNFHPNTWLCSSFIRLAGVQDIVPRDYATDITNIFKFPMDATGGRIDYIFTKNIQQKQVSSIRLLWNSPFTDIGYLSDHAAILATFDFY